MATSKFLKNLWRILKPVVTLGLSLAVAALAKKCNDSSGVINTTGEAISDQIVNSVDDALKAPAADDIEAHL
jgi:hypothetical protein